FVGRTRTGRQRFPQRLAPDQLHAEERPVVGERPQLVDWHHTGVLQLPADLRLLDEATNQVAVIAKLLAEHLDRHFAIEGGIVALEHRSHAAASDLAVDPVADRGADGGGTDGWLGLLAGGYVAELDRGERVDGGSDRLQDSGGSGTIPGGVRRIPR